MKRILNILLLLIILFGHATTVSASQSAKELAKEHQIKAAFLYNFFNFIEWPEDEMSKTDHVTIGIVITDKSKAFVNALKPLTEKKVNNKSIQLKIFDEVDCIQNPSPANDAERQALFKTMKQCQLLMICECNDAHIKNFTAILNDLKGTATLTVGESPQFLEKGGIINFVVEDNKIRFEVNLEAAKQNKLSIRAKLLKLAKRIIKEK